MTAAEFLPFFLFAAISTITPGMTTTLATASGAHFGFRRSLPFMAGVSFGLAAMAVAAAAGLASLLMAQPSLQVAMKAAGTLYLLWLAWKIGRSGPPNLRAFSSEVDTGSREENALKQKDSSNAEVTRPTGFLAAIAVQFQNPKGWTMVLGAAASFAALARGPVELATLLGLTFGLMAAGSLMLWCAAGLLLARLLRSERQWRLLNAALGLLLAASIVPMWL